MQLQIFGLNLYHAFYKFALVQKYLPLNNSISEYYAIAVTLGHSLMSEV